MTDEQKRDLAVEGEKVIAHLQDAAKLLHEINVLMVEKAATGLIADAATMIYNELMTRCKP